ncbi:MAG: hypothetical protein IPG96_19255 [Proteobacteria bacterium]|nr:hypothetical protein [Pseudomonadota bacterium]
MAAKARAGRFGATQTGGASAAPGVEPVLLLGAAPSSAAPAAARPLVLLLHGYGGSPALLAESLGLAALAQRQRWLVLLPAGRRDRQGQRYWRAGPSCCDFFQAEARGDDAARLVALLDQLPSAQRVDPHRRYVVGHSNGGHLAYRMACIAGDRLAAVVSLAGADFGDLPCTPSPRLSVLQVQSDRDPIVPYLPACVARPGRRGALCYPGADATTRRWARRLGCALPRVAAPPLRLAGPTWVSREHHAGCPSGVEVALWTIHGGGHATATFAPLLEAIGTWLADHPRRPRRATNE